jgi:glycosyltransferase involved in cell wall biosynthesis
MFKMKSPCSRDKTIAFFEPRCTGLVHIDSTISIIDMFSKIFPEYRFLFYTDKEHGDIAKRYISMEFEQINISVPKSSKNRREWLKEIFWDFMMMRKIKKAKPEYVICMSHTWLIVLFAKLFQRKQKIIFFFHSMEKEIKQHIPNYRPVWWFWRSLEWEIPAHTQIVFGESIRREIASVNPKLRFKSIDLPRVPCYDRGVLKTPVFTLKKFAALSRGITEAAPDIFLLEQKLGVMPDFFELHFKGAVDCEGRLAGAEVPAGSSVKLLTKRDTLSPEELDSYINMMDFCVFLYPSNYYRFTASGALLEALAHLKPVVALHNPYFDYVFDKMGDVGYLCDTVDEMAAVVKKIVLTGDTTRYNAQRQNIMNGMRLFSTEYLADNMREILGL